MPTPSILIVDDHQLFADALNILLSVNGFSVMGITRSCNQTLVLLDYQQPDLILMDIAILS